jgi:hypothetical protein
MSAFNIEKQTKLETFLEVLGVLSSIHPSTLSQVVNRTKLARLILKDYLDFLLKDA